MVCPPGLVVMVLCCSCVHQNPAEPAAVWEISAADASGLSQVAAHCQPAWPQPGLAACHQALHQGSPTAQHLRGQFPTSPHPPLQLFIWVPQQPNVYMVSSQHLPTPPLQLFIWVPQQPNVYMVSSQHIPPPPPSTSSKSLPPPPPPPRHSQSSRLNTCLVPEKSKLVCSFSQPPPPQPAPHPNSLFWRGEEKCFCWSFCCLWEVKRNGWLGINHQITYMLVKFIKHKM